MPRKCLKFLKLSKISCHKEKVDTMEYISVEKTNKKHYELLKKMMLEYVAELDIHQNTKTPNEIVLKVTKSMIDKLDENRILQIIFDNEDTVGFYYAKIDLVGDKGLIFPNCGYIMEFFVRPDYRRKGIGRTMATVCENQLAENGVLKIWLTADSVTGIPFWLACGYCDSGEISYENNQKILIKEL